MEGESLSIFSLIAGASFLVKMVMLLLLAASVFSWIFIFNRVRVLRREKALMEEFEDQFWSGGELSGLYSQLNRMQTSPGGMANIFIAGFREYARLAEKAVGDAILSGTQRAMRVALAREQELLEQHLSFLATVASTSPYIGLFGTVWGIMNSFRSLANVSQATLNIVAPGIAEALIATAIGLFAAIPAVIAYNRFAAEVDRLMGRYETFADEFSSILHRQLHQG